MNDQILFLVIFNVRKINACQEIEIIVLTIEAINCNNDQFLDDVSLII